MSDSAELAKRVGRCTRCGGTLPADPGRLGQTVCSECGHKVEIGPWDSPNPARPARGEADQQYCPVCQCRVQPDERSIACPECGIQYHHDCWEYNGGCGVYGCSYVPATQQLERVEIPASYWGQEEKVCPSCDTKILAAALRCRHCGAVFSSAQPEDGPTFRARVAVEQGRPAIRRTATLMLVLGILPCTAPLVAVFGPIWYARHRAAVDALPALSNALCKLSVGVAIAQTIVMLAAILLYAIFPR